MQINIYGKHSQHARALGADKGSHGHIDVGWPTLAAIEATFVFRHRSLEGPDFLGPLLALAVGPGGPGGPMMMPGGRGGGRTRGLGPAGVAVHPSIPGFVEI